MVDPEPCKELQQELLYFIYPVLSKWLILTWYFSRANSCQLRNHTHESRFVLGAGPQHQKRLCPPAGQKRLGSSHATGLMA